MAVALPPEIIDLEDFTESINMVLYAEPGIGKTVFAGSDDKVLFLAMRAEQGTISAKRLGSNGKVWKINEWNDLEAAYEWLSANPDAGFSWVVIDSVTAMQKLLMADLLKIQYSENPAKFDLDLPTQQNWQEYYNKFDRFIIAFNDLSYNVLYTATAMQNEDPEGEPIVLPNLYGRQKGYSVAASLCANAGIVGRLSEEVRIKAGGGEVRTREILFKSSPPYVAKDRYNCLPDRFVITRDDERTKTLKDLRVLVEQSSAPKAPAKKVAPPTRRVAPRRPVAPAGRK